MKSEEALERFLSLLRGAGVDPDRPSPNDVAVTWQIMRQFAAERVEDCQVPEQDGDGILAQYGTYGWGAGERFELDMTRQFSFVDAAGEYDHMAQLNCTFDFEPSAELRAAGQDSRWSFGMSLDDFFEQALASQGFSTVRELRLAPIVLRIEYGDV
jgi:hypothetical protein